MNEAQRATALNLSLIACLWAGIVVAANLLTTDGLGWLANLGVAALGLFISGSLVQHVFSPMINTWVYRNRP